MFLTERVRVGQVDWDDIGVVADDTHVIDGRVSEYALVVGIPVDVVHLQIDILDSSNLRLHNAWASSDWKISSWLIRLDCQIERATSNQVKSVCDRVVQVDIEKIVSANVDGWTDVVDTFFDVDLEVVSQVGYGGILVHEDDSMKFNLNKNYVRFARPVST